MVKSQVFSWLTQELWMTQLTTPYSLIYFLHLTSRTLHYLFGFAPHTGCSFSICFADNLLFSLTSYYWRVMWFSPWTSSLSVLILEKSMPVIVVCCCFSHSLSCVWLFCNPMNHNPPGSCVRGTFQARILEWVAISFSRGSHQPGARTDIWIGRWFFTTSHLGSPMLLILQITFLPQSLSLNPELISHRLFDIST